MIHVYRAKDQPATRYVVSFDKERRFVVRIRRRAQLWCHACRRRRWAAYMVAHVYYDVTYFFCRDGHGCKDGSGRWRICNLNGRITFYPKRRHRRLR